MFQARDTLRTLPHKTARVAHIPNKPTIGLMKTNFTLLDGDKVLALNRTDLEINLDVSPVGQIVDLGDGRKWNITGLKEVTYTVELVPEPAVEAPRTFPKDQPSLNVDEPAPAAPRAFTAPTRPVSRQVIPAAKTHAPAKTAGR